MGFSYPVNLAKLKSAIMLRRAGSSGAAAMVSVQPCKYEYYTPAGV